MYFSTAQIMEMASDIKAVVRFDADTLGKRTYNAVAKALKQGYIPTRSGAAATYYGLLVNHFDMPHMCFSRSARWWDGVNFYNLPDGCDAPLSDFWHADRVLYRLEHPEEYQQALSNAYYNSIRDAIKEPNFKELVRSSRNKDNAYMRILSTKDQMHFDKIAQVYVDSFGYQQKLKEALAMLDRGGSMAYQIKGGN